MTSEGWAIVGALGAVAGASLAIRELGEQSTKRGLAVYLLALGCAAGLGYWVAEDLDQSGPLGLTCGLAMVEAAPWVWRLIRHVATRRARR